MVDYDRIFSRIDKIGVSKAFVCDELGKSRSWLHAAKIKHIGMHSLRHTFAANAIRAGVDMRTLSELLGHYDVAFTIRTYGHTDLTTKKHALEKMYGSDPENE